MGIFLSVWLCCRFLYTLPHCVLTTTSQGRALSWKTKAETRIPTEKCILLKVLDLPFQKREIIIKCL